MSESGPANPPVVGNAQPSAAKMFTELKASAHLMTFDPGIYCIVQTPGVRRPDDGSGLPGVRITLPPNPQQPHDAVSISSFRPDGWMSGSSDAMLIRVTSGPAQVLVTIYQAPNGVDNAPRIQVLRISEEQAAAQAAAPARVPGTVAETPTVTPEVVAHVQARGDVGTRLGEWVGERGSKRWIEGFIVAPQPPIAASDIEYQAVLGRGWLSPWVEGTNLCGSRGMALPILGLRLRLRGEASSQYDVSYSATFIDGTAVGPVPAGEACEAESLAPMEAFQLVFAPRGSAAEIGEAAAGGAAKPAAPRGIRGKAPVKRPR